MAEVVSLKVEALEGGQIHLSGREAWALYALMRAGEKGITPIERPAPRWSHYIMLLRRRGLVIETVNERHGGPFTGRHGRYVLRSKVRLLSACYAKGASHAA